ncbi:MAG: glycoside hydrolase family 26 protein [Chlorobi bacterium]|nr:glycoside hydrolase family 26 protein [Chlorobiota bacterium]MCI0715880.1 glycoside hydrolase family 26 protein [Chlorobiota bacterium]
MSGHHKAKFSFFTDRNVCATVLSFFILTIAPVNLFSMPKELKLLPPENGIYHTAFSTMYSSSNNVSENEVPYFTKLVNKNIVWLNFANDWFGGIKFPAESVKNIYKHGVIPSIRMLPWSRYDKNDLTYSLKKISSGKFDKELRQWVKDLKSANIPVLIDFAGEPNGDWFPWSGVYNGGGINDKYGDKSLADGPELYRDAYIHIINLFRDEDVTNVTWVFHVNAVGAPQEDWNRIKNYYPGDEYIDWIGFSAYGPQRWGESYQRFVDIMQSGYNELAELTPNKPIAVLEFGVADYLPNVNKALWIQSALYTVQQPEFSRIKAVGWWHSTWWNADGTMSAIQIDSSPDALRFYKEAIAQPVFVGEYKLTQ